MLQLFTIANHEHEEKTTYSKPMFFSSMAHAQHDIARHFIKMLEEDIAYNNLPDNDPRPILNPINHAIIHVADWCDQTGDFEPIFDAQPIFVDDAITLYTQQKLQAEIETRIPTESN